MVRWCFSFLLIPRWRAVVVEVMRAVAARTAVLAGEGGILLLLLSFASCLCDVPDVGETCGQWWPTGEGRRSMVEKAVEEELKLKILFCFFFCFCECE